MESRDCHLMIFHAAIVFHVRGTCVRIAVTDWASGASGALSIKRAEMPVRRIDQKDRTGDQETNDGDVW